MTNYTRLTREVSTVLPRKHWSYVKRRGIEYNVTHGFKNQCCRPPATLIKHYPVQQQRILLTITVVSNEVNIACGVGKSGVYRKSDNISKIISKPPD